MPTSPTTDLPAAAPPPLEADAAALRDAVWRYLCVLGADAATADDLVQEAFVVALRRAGFDASVPAATFAFLRTTARHLWLKSRRRRVTEREIEEADRVWDARCEDRGAAYLAALAQCLDELPDRGRALIDATYGGKRGRAASAAATGLSKDGVKSALRRLRAFLQGCVERRLGGEP
ncbi:MAG: sigma-70 family RNA polymerase sigma factor [Planctomycetota bacterium]